MKTNEKSALAYKKRLQDSQFTIYDEIKIADPALWVPAPELEILLTKGLQGQSLRGLPLRTRSKRVKTLVCEALGYPVPTSFRKTKPRFPGQCFDTYVQKSNNLQVWNEELAPNRRYALIRVSDDDKITKIRVVDGVTLALLDTTGTLTQKYQARITNISQPFELISKKDTDHLSVVINKKQDGPSKTDSPTDHPARETLLPISEIFERLKPIVGTKFKDLGSDQERNRGGHLHRLVCTKLGYSDYEENGRFPDVPHQLLEIKLQTSPTVDLGLVTPSSSEHLDSPAIEKTKVRHKDVRYALFCAIVKNSQIEIQNLLLVTGEEFFDRFTRFEGKIINRKLQIPLPANFFED